MSSVAPVLAAAKAEGRAALIGYLPVGFPDHDASVAAMVAMLAAMIATVSEFSVACWISSFLNTRPYQSKVKPPQTVIERMLLNEYTAITRIGAYRNRTHSQAVARNPG